MYLPPVGQVNLPPQDAAEGIIEQVAALGGR